MRILELQGQLYFNRTFCIVNVGMIIAAIVAVVILIEHFVL